MRFRRHGTPLLWLVWCSLFAHSIAATLPDTKKALSSKDTAPLVNEEDLAIATSIKSPGAGKEIGTKDAPVDGRDGKPHAGPWVGKDVDASKKPALVETEDRVPLSKKEKYTNGQGGAIPDKNDGVMDDENRKAPQVGTTGTEGGVSAKSEKQKAAESVTGEKLEKKPASPKEGTEVHGLSVAEEERIRKHNVKTGKVTERTPDKEKDTEKPRGAQGLEKPDLPGKPKSSSSSKDIPKKGTYLVDTLPYTEGHKEPEPKLSSGGGASSDPEDGIIQPLHSFVLALIMILFSEVGDKTFLVAALMAMRHDRLVVFTAALSALVAMTILSAVLGHTVPALLPRRFVAFAASLLFLVFGAKMLREGLAMPKDSGVGEEMREVEAELEEKEANLRPSNGALEAGRGRAATVSRAANLPPRAASPASDDDARPSSGRAPAAKAPSTVIAGLANLFSLVLSPAWVQTFVMTFLGEWGDRSQIATIAMAAGQDYWWVSAGAVAGHAVCTGVAVIGGRALAGKVSMRVVTIGGAAAFLVFGVIYLIESFYSG